MFWRRRRNYRPSILPSFPPSIYLLQEDAGDICALTPFRFLCLSQIRFTFPFLLRNTPRTCNLIKHFFAVNTFFFLTFPLPFIYLRVCFFSLSFLGRFQNVHVVTRFSFFIFYPVNNRFFFNTFQSSIYTFLLRATLRQRFSLLQLHRFHLRHPFSP